MVLNSTSGNLYNVENSCRDVCKFTKNMCTVFAVHDLCKDMIDALEGKVPDAEAVKMQLLFHDLYDRARSQPHPGRIGPRFALKYCDLILGDDQI